MLVEDAELLIGLSSILQDQMRNEDPIKVNAVAIEEI